jgi:hypothetical protein
MTTWAGFFFFLGEGPRSRRFAALRFIVQPYDDDYFFSFLRVMEYRWNETDRRKPKYSGGGGGGGTCPRAPLGVTNPAWTDPGSSPGLRGERPATKRLSHGTALMWVELMLFMIRTSGHHFRSLPNTIPIL